MASCPCCCTAVGEIIQLTLLTGNEARTAALGWVNDTETVSGSTTWIPSGASCHTGLQVQVEASARSQLNLTASDRKSTRLNSSHANIPYAVFCLKKNNVCTAVY